GEFERVAALFARPVALTRRELQQLLGVKRYRIGFDRGRGGNGGGDDLALRLQALDARIDEAGTELVDVKESEEERGEPAQVEDEDPAGQRGRESRPDAAKEATPTLRCPLEEPGGRRSGGDVGLKLG